MTPWWWPRRQPAPVEYLNEQQYDEAGHPLLVEVPTRFDPLTGDPVEWVFAVPDAARDWDDRVWKSHP